MRGRPRALANDKSPSLREHDARGTAAARPLRCAPPPPTLPQPMGGRARGDWTFHKWLFLSFFFFFFLGAGGGKVDGCFLSVVDSLSLSRSPGALLLRVYVSSVITSLAFYSRVARDSAAGLPRPRVRC